MILAPSIAPASEFEKILELAKNELDKIVKQKTISSSEFEEICTKILQEVSKNTAFEGKINQTDDLDFPDIVANNYYGVEVKKTMRRDFKSYGNSIFEANRVTGIEKVYVLIANRNEVRWWPYEDALENIVVTHSPRYAINGNATDTVFSKIGMTYDDYRKLSQTEKMESVRKLYGDRSLWWLSKTTVPQYRFYSSLSPEEKLDFLIKSFVFCPEIFSSKSNKYEKVAVLALSEGIVLPNVRDLFSAGGKWNHQGIKYPQIYGKLYDNNEKIKFLLEEIDIEKLTNFWGEAKQNISLTKQWIAMVQINNKNQFKLKNLGFS